MARGKPSAGKAAEQLFNFEPRSAVCSAKVQQIPQPAKESLLQSCYDGVFLGYEMDDGIENVGTRRVA